MQPVRRGLPPRMRGNWKEKSARISVGSYILQARALFSAKTVAGA
jgi:hypothetical protein